MINKRQRGLAVSSKKEQGEISQSRTRSFVKIQDGCNNFCSYCIVPLVRQFEECVPPKKVLDDIKEKQEQGYREIVITGVEIGSYNCDGYNLQNLLELILNETNICRFRISSLQPREITRELIGLWQNPRLCRHFHLSLQSGSDAILKKMERSYSTGDYTRAVGIIYDQVPQAAITTDVIVGFPGETDADFMATCDFCKRTKFARIHVFPYSRREGTKAAGFSDTVGERIKKQRVSQLLSLAEDSLADFNSRFQGQELEVLFEQKANGLWSGLTDNYIRVYAESQENLINRIVNLKLKESRGDGMKGEILL